MTTQTFIPDYLRTMSSELKQIRKELEAISEKLGNVTKNKEKDNGDDKEGKQTKKRSQKNGKKGTQAEGV